MKSLCAGRLRCLLEPPLLRAAQWWLSSACGMVAGDFLDAMGLVGRSSPKSGAPSGSREHLGGLCGPPDCGPPQLGAAGLLSALVVFLSIVPKPCLGLGGGRGSRWAGGSTSAGFRQSGLAGLSVRGGGVMRDLPAWEHCHHRS